VALACGFWGEPGVAVGPIYEIVYNRRPRAPPARRPSLNAPRGSPLSAPYLDQIVEALAHLLLALPNVSMTSCVAEGDLALGSMSLGTVSRLH
jgi:hypothetical protein